MSEFSTDNPHRLTLLYRGLVSLVENATGVDFHNEDPGHMFYRFAAKGERWSGEEEVDDADSNNLFLMIKASFLTYCA